MGAFANFGWEIFNDVIVGLESLQKIDFCGPRFERCSWILLDRSNWLSWRLGCTIVDALIAVKCPQRVALLSVLFHSNLIVVVQSNGFKDNKTFTESNKRIQTIIKLSTCTRKLQNCQSDSYLSGNSDGYLKPCCFHLVSNIMKHLRTASLLWVRLIESLDSTGSPLPNSTY